LKKVTAIFFFTSLINFWIAPQKNGQFIYETKESKLPFTVTQYSSKHGLPQNQVLEILELPNGKLLISTANGVVQFDGQLFTTFTNDKKHKKYIFNDLFYESSGKKILGTTLDGSLFCLEPFFIEIKGFLRSTINEGKIYSVSKNGSIYESDLKKIKFKKIFSNLNIHPNHFLHNNGSLFVCSNEGLDLITVSQGKQKKITKTPTFKSKIFKNKLYYSTQLTFECLDLKTNKSKIIFKSSYSDNIFLDFEVVSEKEFYLASNHGLVHLKNLRVNLYNQENNLPSNNIHSVFYSKKNNCLFVGTAQKGLLKLDFKTSFSITEPNEIKLNSLSSIIEFDNKILTSGSSGTIFDITNKNQTKVFLRSNYLLASLAKIDDYLAVGTWGAGFSVYKNGQEIKNFSSSEYLKNLYVHSIFQDSKKQIWIGTGSGISFGKTLKEIKPLIEIGATVICFKELRDKTICIGTNEGVLFLKNNKIFKKITRKDGFFGKEVRSFYEDSNGRLWIGTYNGGIFCYYKNKLESINLKANCKLPMDIFCIAKGENDMLYFTGNLGLYAVKERDLFEFSTQKKDFLIPYFFIEESGIYNTEFNGGFQNNFYKNGNTFYFPSIEGICIFKPIKISSQSTNLQFESIYINDAISKFTNSIFPPETYSLKIFFSKANFNSNKQHFFQFSLEKNQNQHLWSRLQTQNSVSFSALPPGKYKLKIRAIDSDNKKSPQTIIYNFEIKPFFYQTWIFFLICALLLIIFSGLIVRWRMSIHEKQIIFNNKINNQILELKLAAIQSKMNPHFIFNVLNNIKYLLMYNKNNQAELLVDDFSSLMRKFLVYNDKFFTTIAEEIEFIKLYVNIEKTRLKNSFEFNIFLDEQIKHSIIPNMLIQPFIENAIKHGLSHNTESSVLSLNINKNGDFIVIQIQDNGIGIENSKKMKNSQNPHESKGIKLVESKIENLRLKYHVFVNLMINEQKESINSGTIVELKILIENENELRNN
jgi:hypothetical protein